MRHTKLGYAPELNMKHTIKQITDDLPVGYDENGKEIKAERLQKWAYNQLAAAPALLAACKAVNDIINSYSHIKPIFNACEILNNAISKAEKED